MPLYLLIHISTDVSVACLLQYVSIYYNYNLK